MAPPTNDELLSLETLGAPTLSPLGDLVVFTVTSTDWEQDSFVSQLWLAPADGSSPPRQLTTDKSGASGPQWSPDGTYITFVASRGAVTPTKPFLRVGHMYTATIIYCSKLTVPRIERPRPACSH